MAGDSGTAPVSKRELGAVPSPPAVPRPLSRSVLWMPRSWDSSDASIGRGIDLFIWQRPLREIAGHIARPGAAEGYGLLTGALYHCPVSGTSYLAIDDAHPADDVLPKGEDPQHIPGFREFWLEVSMQASARKRQLVGWYHAHARLGVVFSKWDERLHVHHFPNRWQCALVLTSNLKAFEGGFFQRDSVSGAFGSTLAPFYEVLPERAIRDEPVATWVGWENYRADRPVMAPAHPHVPEAAFEFVSLEETLSSGDPQGNGAPAEAHEDLASRLVADEEATADGPSGTADDGSSGTAGGPSGTAGTVGTEWQKIGTEEGRATVEKSGAEIGGAPAPTPFLLPDLPKAPRMWRPDQFALQRRSWLAAAGLVALAAVALTVLISARRISLPSFSEGVGLELSAPARKLDSTVSTAAGQSAADGQAGANPLARGQNPGAPSATKAAGLGGAIAVWGRELAAGIDEYHSVRATDGDGSPDCAALGAAYGRVEAAHATLLEAAAASQATAASRAEAAGGPVEALLGEAEAAGLDYQQSGCH